MPRRKWSISVCTPRAPRKHALLIGVAKPDGEETLKTVYRDVELVRKLLIGTFFPPLTSSLSDPFAVSTNRAAWL
jgi:hypothetical protein